jgi:glutamate---cysteine ligase / carboxylate-amine ligase
MEAMLKKGFFSLGVEEEFQIVDPNTGELRSHIEEVLKDGNIVLRESARREMHQSVVETGTGICKNVDEARKEITSLRTELSRVARQAGLTIASAGTHPFSHWLDQEITDHERYDGLVEELQAVARKNLIFGLHVHVGFPDREAAIPVINAASYFVPHILALSVNSPYWLGQDTGWSSYRIKVFENFPRTGLPQHFHSHSEYEDYVKKLVGLNCIDNPKKIWWDIRLHPTFDTIEFRMCDCQMRVDETIALTALIQALVSKLYRLNRSNLTFRQYRRMMIDENRHRAARFGTQGKLIDFAKMEEVHYAELFEELVEFVEDEAEKFGTMNEINYLREMVKNGTGAQRQRKAFAETGSHQGVVEYIIKETHVGLGVEAPTPGKAVIQAAEKPKASAKKTTK